MDERRQHRTPFVAIEREVQDAGGKLVAHCATDHIASFLTVTANYFDRFSAALKVCKAERQSEGRELSPAQQDLDKLLDEYEAELRK